MQTMSLGNPFINLKGEWKEDEDYKYLDAVTNRGSLFIANKKRIPAGIVPGENDAWLLSARGGDEEQEKELIRILLSEHEKLLLMDGVHNFPQGKEDQVLTIKEGKLVFEYKYPLCEFITWRHPTLKKGFEPAQGGVIENAKEMYPDAWEYLQTDEGQLLCVTEDEWQAMTKATWVTLAGGTGVGFNGIGGAPFYVQNLDTETLRLPDLRGMYAEASGFDELGVGGVHGDMVRNITGSFRGTGLTVAGTFSASGILSAESSYVAKGAGSGSTTTGNQGATLDASRAVPTGNANKPRAWGALVCVFLGTPQTISEVENDANN